VLEPVSGVMNQILRKLQQRGATDMLAAQGDDSEVELQSLRSEVW
jgi:hypothetical protein